MTFRIYKSKDGIAVSFIKSKAQNKRCQPPKLQKAARLRAAFRY